MDIRFDDNLKKRVGRAGSVLVMVVVLTVLLALIGVLFVVMARVDNMSAVGVSNNADLHAAVEAVVDQIKTVMVEDLFGTMPIVPTARVTINEMEDSPVVDLWLASLEPVRTDGGTGNESDDTYNWPYLSQVYGTLPDGRTDVTAFAGPAANSITDADADGDGVSDSRWVVIPRMRSTKGKDIYAAIRIIDNCAMLNLNTAHTKDSSTELSYLEESSYLSAVNYERFLRGADTNNDGTFDIPPALDNIRIARNRSGLPGSVEDHHGKVVMHIENPNAYIVPPDPNPGYSLFDIGDELEIRNRYMLTSKVESRFEQTNVAHYTLDAGGGLYGALSIPRTNSTFTQWKWRVNPLNFDNDSGGTKLFKYDRRHVCTFYSFDRNLRKRDYPLVDVAGDTIDRTQRDYILASKGDVFIPRYGAAGINDITSNTLQSRKNILHLLYALRAYFIDTYQTETYKQAARRAAQYVANMIDYADDADPTTEGPFYDSGPPPVNTYDYGGQRNDDPTYINRDIIRELILEVSEDSLGAGNEIDIDVDAEYDFGFGIDVSTEIVYGYERQPFISELYCENVSGTADDFRVELCNPYPNPNGQMSLEGWQISIGTDSHTLNSGDIIDAAGASGGLGRLVITKPGWEIDLLLGDTIKLQRPDPTDPTGNTYITVDETVVIQTTHLLSPADNTYASKRDDTGWKFIDNLKYQNDTAPTLNAANNITSPPGTKGYQLPVENNPAALRTLRGLEGVTFLGNGGPDGTITQQITSVVDEGDVHFDIENDTLLEYISLMNRPEGRLPGRININTATMEVIRAAIPENAPWAIDADALTSAIVAYRNTNAFTKISELLNVPGFRDFENNAIADNVGDLEIEDKIEERDWILSRLANIFTVRSDTFTAYILVRLGTDGPQKRMIAILDRTGVSSPNDKPRLVALHPVPDPR